MNKSTTIHSSTATKQAVGGGETRRLAVTAAIGALLSIVFVALVKQTLYPLEMLVGWGLATANVMLAFVLHAKAIAAANNREFVTWGIVANSCRIVLLVGAIAVVALIFNEPIPFLIAVLVTYFTAKFNEVLSLYGFANERPETNG
mgnify:FL=1|jgi:hypothetical protein